MEYLWNQEKQEEVVCFDQVKIPETYSTGNTGLTKRGCSNVPTEIKQVVKKKFQWKVHSITSEKVLKREKIIKTRIIKGERFNKRKESNIGQGRMILMSKYSCALDTKEHASHVL